MSRAFINFMKKDVLSSSLKELGLNYEGTVDEMRSQLRSYLDNEEIPPDHELFIQNLRVSHDPATTGKDLRVPAPPFSRASSPISTSDTNRGVEPNQSEVCDKVRKWGIKYDGGRDPLGFLERIEELATCYAISRNTLLNFMPELFKGDALSWYRNNRKNWKSYNDFEDDFKIFYLPVRFFETLDDEIRNRVQHCNESFVDYVTAIQSLMRWANLSGKDQLERIFRNCRAEYKVYIKRREFTKLRELIILAQEFENIRVEETTQKKKARQAPPAVAAISQNMVCFRCGNTGHMRSSCVNPQIIFCWDCGKRDVKTIECCRKGMGNSRGGPSTREGEDDL